MPTIESQQPLREKVIKAGVGGVLSKFTEKYLKDANDRIYNAAIASIKQFVSDNPHAITDQLAQQLDNVLREMNPSEEEKKRTQTLDQYYDVRGADPRRILDKDKGQGEHDADNE